MHIYPILQRGGVILWHANILQDIKTFKFKAGKGGGLLHVGFALVKKIAF